MDIRSFIGNPNSGSGSGDVIVGNVAAASQLTIEPMATAAPVSQFPVAGTPVATGGPEPSDFPVAASPEEMVAPKQENDEDCPGDDSETGKRLKTDNKQPGKPKNTLVWNHVITAEQPNGTTEQKCKFCDKTKSSRQLQTTFWTMHLVDPSKGCPNCPLEVRQQLAATTRSAEVHRAASQISDQTPAMIAAKLNNPPIRRKRKSEGAKSPAVVNRPKLQQLGKRPIIVSLCGSCRTGSFNKMLHDHVMHQMGGEGAVLKEVNLAELNLPIYDADLERDQFPESAKQLKKDLVAADGIFICSPEYNGFVTPLLLNAITWATRGEGRMYAGFKEKVVLIMSASPGTMGGIRMIRSLQEMMNDLGAIVVSGNHAIGNAFQTFDQEGQICDERAVRKVEAAAYQMVRYSRFHANKDGDSVMDDNVMRMHNMGEYGRVDW